MSDERLLQWIYTIIGGLFTYTGFSLSYGMIFNDANSISSEEWTVQNSVGEAFAEVFFEEYYFEFVILGVLLLIIGIIILVKNRKVWQVFLKKNNT